MSGIDIDWSKLSTEQKFEILRKAPKVASPWIRIMDAADDPDFYDFYRYDSHWGSLANALARDWKDEEEEAYASFTVSDRVAFTQGGSAGAISIRDALLRAMKRADEILMNEGWELVDGPVAGLPEEKTPSVSSE